MVQVAADVEHDFPSMPYDGGRGALRRKLGAQIPCLVCSSLLGIFVVVVVVVAMAMLYRRESSCREAQEGLVDALAARY